MFKKDKFGELLVKARGKRSLNAYARDCEVSSAYISKLIRGLIETAPSPVIIKKLADRGQDITYEKLMAAAGHISSPQEERKKADAKIAYLMKYFPLLPALPPSYSEKYKILTSEEKEELDEFAKNATQEELTFYINNLRLSNIQDVNTLLRGAQEAAEIKKDRLISMAPQTVFIPILGVITCRNPINAVENFPSFRYESPETLPSGNLYYLKAKGDSMEPTIPNGSDVLIREQPDVEYGDIAAVLVNDDTEVTLKRVRKQGNTLILMPDNPAYSPIIVDPENPAMIIGKAVRYTQNL